MKLTKEQKRDNEIAKWERERSKPKGKWYLPYFLVLISVIYVADEVTSQIGSQMQTVIASQIFAPVVGAEFAVARMSAFGAISMIGVILSFFYKPLSDRYGRRIFLIINTIGMGVGTLAISLATSIPAYLVGTVLCTFFIPHDMQAVYLQECAPPEHRAKMYASVKAIATLGIFIVPFLRMIFIPSTDLSNWRFVYMVPAVLTIIAGVAAMFGIRESDAFIETRLHQLRMTDEEKAAAKERKQVVDANGGFGKAFKYCFTHKQVRNLMIVCMFTSFAMVITGNYEAVMTNGYAQQYLNAGMDLENARLQAVSYVTQALMLFSIGSALFQFIPGFVADKYGRKISAVATSVCMLVFFLLFYFGASNAWNPYLVGFLCGASVGCYLCLIDTVGLMIAESTPTSLRASMASVLTLFCTVFSVVSSIVMMILVNIMGDTAIGICCLALSVPGIAVGLLLLTLKVKETKGIDMANVLGDEFDK